MKKTDDFYFQSYAQWHQAITEHCNIQLTSDYTQGRIRALSDSNDLQTVEFAKKYGEAYLQQVIQWFEQAQSESA